MITPVGAGPFAVGLAIEKRDEVWHFSRGGSNWGFRGQLIAHVNESSGAAIMTTGDRGSTLTDDLVVRIASVYSWDSLDKPIVR